MPDSHYEQSIHPPSSETPVASFFCATYYDETRVSLEIAIPRSEQWLLFLAQLPAAPSSTRVAIWRRLKAAGATSVLNGAWVLPKNDKHQALFSELAQLAREHGGQATLFVTENLSSSEREEIVNSFRSDRVRDYEEFTERVQALLSEIARETKRKKFSYAELEEIEDDFSKLSRWLDKIGERDFFPDPQSNKARAALASCADAIGAFAEQVYAQEGLTQRPQINEHGSRKHTAGGDEDDHED